MEIIFNPTIKQFKALEYLDDKITQELLFGGGAGGGKSLLGCFWLITSCLKYKGSRWLIGRAVLKHLKESTIKTMFDVLKNIFHFKQNVHYFYNSIEGLIKFPNKSEIVLKDLFAYPSDPEFDSLGSMEYTGAFIDEGSQITPKAKEILLSRLRYKIDEFGIIGKLLICSNPCKNFLYYEFYKPWRDKKLIEFRVFVQALAKDNPHLPKSYITNLKRRDKITKERLLYGNWEYDDDPTRLFDYDSIIDMFTNDAERGKKYLTVDVAGRGRDKTVLMFWDRFFIERIELKDNISSKELDDILIANKIPRSHCTVDEDGVGFGLVKDLKGIKGFVNNSQPIRKEKETNVEKLLRNYKNLKAQCWFELANYVDNGQIGIYREVKVEIKELLIEDLEQIKQRDVGKDTPLRIVTKDEIKEKLGRSTDIGDAMMMRMIFELKHGMAFAFA